MHAVPNKSTHLKKRRLRSGNVINCNVENKAAGQTYIHTSSVDVVVKQNKNSNSDKASQN